MHLTFKDKVLSLYRRTIRVHRWLKGPMIVLSVILLSFDRLISLMRARTRKYIGALLTFTFAFMSCSFSGAIWGDGNTDFADTTQIYYSETEESYASLAVEQEVDESALILDDEEDVTDEELIQDISTVDTVSGADILENILLDDIDEESQSGDMPVESDELVFDRSDWQLVLINKNHPIADDYEFVLGTISGNMKCDDRILPDLYSMIDAAYKDGVNLVICSPYRDTSRQEMLFGKKVSRYMAQGMSYMEAYKLAGQAVTIPGSSEHQVGLALDIICDYYSALNEGFGDTEAGKWLAEHSYEYGFVIRYPEGKEDITGIEYEPWHLRYVGKNAAKVIYDEKITLEEFWEKYL